MKTGLKNVKHMEAIKMKLKTKRFLAWLFIGVVLTISGMFIGVLFSGFLDYNFNTCLLLGTVSFWGLFAIQHRRGPSFK